MANLQNVFNTDFVVKLCIEKSREETKQEIEKVFDERIAQLIVQKNQTKKKIRELFITQNLKTAIGLNKYRVIKAEKMFKQKAADCEK